MRVAGAVKSLVNATKGLNFECTWIIGYVGTSVMYNSETTVWNTKSRFMAQSLQIYNLRVVLGVERLDKRRWRCVVYSRA